jgi:hypothetical protein
MGRRIYILLFFLFPLCEGATLFGQNPTSEATVDRRSIRIGEQFNLKLLVRYNEGTEKSKVTWPVLDDSLEQHIEVLSHDTITSKLVDRASVLYEQKSTYILTCFDSGTWIIPAVPFIVNDDTTWTQPIELYVNTVPVDTTKPIRDIADIYDVPAPPENPDESNAAMWWWIGGSILLVTAIVVFLLVRRKKTAPILPAPVGHVLQPHEILIQQLNEMYVTKPWRNGDEKKHYTALSEIMRSWVVDRFRFHAREMTTFEIVARLRRTPDRGNKTSELEHVLKTADLVKFAKAVPDDYVNEKCIEHAIQFVQSTAMAPMQVLQSTTNTQQES